MFLARVLTGQKPQVYFLTVPRPARSWQFVSYQRGAAAIAETELQALVAARRELARKGMRKLYRMAS